MSAHAKAADKLARQFFRLSVVGGAVSPERVSGILEYVGKHRPANPLMVLRAYHRLIATELARGRALVEHAGPAPEPVLREIAEAMTGKYRRPIAAVAQPNPALIAGLRVRVGDDVYESSIAGRLASLD
jgi:F-type H+-transporting ATPase subunit delta